mgnify:FL=1
MLKIAKVAVEGTLYHFDMEFDYIIPENIDTNNLVGSRVLVPFGLGNKKKHGVVFEVVSGKLDEKIKPIYAVLDKAPLLSVEMISLARWMKRRYYCTLFDAVKTMLPSGINRKLVNYYKLSDNINFLEKFDLNDIEINIIEILKKKDKFISYKKLQLETSVDNLDKILLRLKKLGIILQKEDSINKVSDASIKMVSVTDIGKVKNLNLKLTQKQKKVYDAIKACSEISVKEVCYYTGVTASVVDSLVKKGIVYYFENQVYRNPYKNIEKLYNKEDILLSDEQKTSFNNLYKEYTSGKASVSLLYGVTGSGKTAVFMKLIEAVRKDKKGIIVMVPEIALTSSLIRQFHQRFGEKVAVFHSGLSAGERADEWKRVKNGDADIAIGTRSAVFAPFENLGLIIMDEEQEYTYKSDSSPRFHARDIAKFRCKQNNTLLVLASATPSIESYYMALNGRYSLNTISRRYGQANLPKVKIVDLNEEINKGNNSAFSEILIKELVENLQNHKQSIILMNRRGYNTFASCRACNEVLTCPNCSISLTYHSANGRLMCHYCGYSVEFTDECPNCHEHEIRYLGFGTQKIEEDLQNVVPEARILRMDADTTMAKFSHDRKFRLFSEGKYDIMIGTQMVAKGLDFDNVTLVGVLSADQSLYNNDFRSYERTFSLLTQVVGRAGRGNYAGRAIIQTYTPENSVISLAAQQNYDEFYNSEIKMRKAMLYPPFVDLCVICFSGKNQERILSAAKDFFNMLRKLASKDYSELPLRVLEPSQTTIIKLNNKYRHKLIIKFRNSRRFQELISRLLVWFEKDKKYSEVSVYVDVNPDMII